MITVKLEDLYDYFEIEKNQFNVIAIKAILYAMSKTKFAYYKQQIIVLNESIFLKLWNIYIDSLKYFDINYNRKSDILIYFNRLISTLFEEKTLNFFALFCPGYTKDGYKDYLGNTTIWKLKELKEVKSMLEMHEVKNNIYCFYSDVFLENCSDIKNLNWLLEMKLNRELFHIEGKKYFDESFVKNMSDLELFSHKYDIEGYINEKIVNGTSKRIYDGFYHCNKKFYKKLNFSLEEIKYRNDKLLTMYKLLSDYINQQNCSMFLPMENMYERENIFSSNNTGTMYLKLKK